VRDRTLVIIAVVFVAAVIVLGGFLRNPVAQVLDTILRSVRLID